MFEDDPPPSIQHRRDLMEQFGIAALGERGGLDANEVEQLREVTKDVWSVARRKWPPSNAIFQSFTQRLSTTVALNGRS